MSCEPQRDLVFARARETSSNQRLAQPPGVAYRTQVLKPLTRRRCLRDDIGPGWAGGDERCRPGASIVDVGRWRLGRPLVESGRSPQAPEAQDQNPDRGFQSRSFYLLARFCGSNARFLHPGLDGGFHGHEQDGNRSAPERVAHDARAPGRRFLRPHKHD
jgi:hypothetical protein